MPLKVTLLIFATLFHPFSSRSAVSTSPENSNRDARHWLAPWPGHLEPPHLHLHHLHIHISKVNSIGQVEVGQVGAGGGEANDTEFLRAGEVYGAEGWHSEGGVRGRGEIEARDGLASVSEEATMALPLINDVANMEG